MSGSPLSLGVATDDPPAEARGEPIGDARRAGRDDGPTRGTSGGASGPSGGDWRPRGRAFWLPYALIVAWTVGICTVNAFSTLREHERLHQALLPWQAFLYEYSSAFFSIALAPFIYVMLQRFKLRGRRLPVDLAAHALATLGFSVAHVAGMVGLRKLVFALLGKTYLFGLGVEFLYEYRKDFFAYAMMLAGFWLVGRLLELERALAERREAPPAVAPPGMLALRDGATTLQVRIGDMLWAASAGNYVEIALSDGRKPLIRGTLRGFEATLGPHGFVRVHRTRLVNIGRVVAVESKESGDLVLSLDDGSRIAGSRRYRDRLKTLGLSA
jgi:hypothetical protein